MGEDSETVGATGAEAAGDGTAGAERATGGCLCGAVRYEAHGPPLATLYCHCTSCRKHTGAAAVALVGYRRDRVRYTKGAPAVYASSPGVGRAFCADCGTPLTWEGDGEDEGPLIEFLVGTMDAPERFAPARHIHYGERLAWFDTTDRLPRHAVWEDEPPVAHAPAARPED
ncbi:MAG: GFA family protein [Alphaproteobacteria bacterium]|nr:GFA family protein [Alphaproteobacteria bacterium]